jgi:hypothetical protein
MVVCMVRDLGKRKRNERRAQRAGRRSFQHIVTGSDEQKLMRVNSKRCTGGNRAARAFVPG